MQSHAQMIARCGGSIDGEAAGALSSSLVVREPDVLAALIKKPCPTGCFG